MVQEKILVNPTFRLDITGKLYKNKEKVLDVQDSLIFNELFTRLSIYKGDLVTFPNMGLKQHLYKLNFEDELEIAQTVQEFENDVSDQMKQRCSIEYTLNRLEKHVELTFELENLKVPIDISYSNMNNSIRIIDKNSVNE